MTLTVASGKGEVGAQLFVSLVEMKQSGTHHHNPKAAVCEMDNGKLLRSKSLVKVTVLAVILVED